METAPRRSFPTLQSNCSLRCNNEKSNSDRRSPLTLPYTMEHIVQSMKSPSNSEEINIFVSPSSHASDEKNFFCSIGHDKSPSSNSVPLEDVLRWKEYRHKQKNDSHSLPNVDSSSSSTAGSSGQNNEHDLESTKKVEIDPLGFPTQKDGTTVSEAPTEVCSNTLFRLLSHHDTRGKDEGLISSTHGKPDLQIDTSTKPAAAPLSTRSISSNMSTVTDTSALERFGESKKAYTNSNEWDDDIAPTLDVEAINDMNVSTVSSNWDPLHVTTILEEEEENADLDVNIQGSMEDGESPEMELKSPCAVTLTEVKTFMSKLDALREEQRTMNSENSHTSIPTGGDSKTSQDIPEIQENTDDAYLQSLLEKKERLRQHKLESQRKRNELDERLKAMRDKLTSPCESTNESLVVLGDVGATPESGNSSFVPALTGARWSGGRAIWGNSPKSTVSAEKKASASTEEPSTQDRGQSAETNRATRESCSAVNPPVKSPLHNAVSMTGIGAGLERVSSDQEDAQLQHSRSVSLQQNSAVTVNVEDDFSFKPAMSIPFSPVVVSKSASKFSFSSPDIHQSMRGSTPPESPANVCNVPEQSSARAPSNSPDVSEGDKSAGFGYIFGDKSVASKSSSKFVELGQYDPTPKGETEEQSLVGRTVKGSKEKKHERKTPSISPQCRAEKTEESPPRVVAPDPPGVESSDVWIQASSRLSKKSLKSPSVDCSNVPHDDAAPTDAADAKAEVAKQPSLSIQPPPLSPVVESASSDQEFDSIIHKAKTISNTPRTSLNTPRSCIDTPRAANTASLKSPRFRAERESKISALKSKFEAEGLVSPSNAYNSNMNWTKPSNQFGMDSTKMWSVMNEFYASSKPTTSFFDQTKRKPVIKPYSMVAPTLSDVKEELTQVDSLDSSISSFKGLNIRELRSKFENNESLSVGSYKKRSSSKSKELNARPSLSAESDADENECADGENSMDTSKVLTYAKKIEQDHPDVAKMEESGSGETENSSKENILDQTADVMFHNFSPVTVRKKAFETRKQQLRVRSATPKNDGGSLQNTVLVSQSSNVPAEQPEVQPMNSIAQSSTPRLSVKERVASFNSPDAYKQGMMQPRSQRQMVPFQKLTPPPGSIQMSYTNQTPSPLCTSSQQEGTMFSPMDSFASPTQQYQQRRQVVRNQMSASSPATLYQNRGISQQRSQPYSLKAVETSYDDDDYDDGITLSPTCSEVSGLTLPTCLGSVAEDKPRAKTDVQCMSPIARHRQKQQGAASNGTLFNHPYLKRMMSNLSTPRTSGHQPQLASVQEKRPSHREQIISRVIDKPSSPRKSNQSALTKKPPTTSNQKPIKKSVSNQSTLTSVASHLIEVQSPQRKRRPQQTISNQSSLTTSSSSNTADLQPPQCTSQPPRTATKKGKVAERVAMVERSSRRNEVRLHQPTSKIASRGAKEAKKRYIKQASDEQNSAATRDCIRLT